MADDYIRREDAKDALQEKVFHNLTDEFYGVMQVLDELEPADVAPVVHGKWIEDEGEGYNGIHCSQCRFPIPYGNVMMGYNFCPKCGADMRCEQDG